MKLDSEFQDFYFEWGIQDFLVQVIYLMSNT